MIRKSVYNVLEEKGHFACTSEADPMEYMSLGEAAKQRGIWERRIRLLCGKGRIQGAFCLGCAGSIPQGTVQPTDAGIKSGRYIKRPEGTGNAGGNRP